MLWGQAETEQYLFRSRRESGTPWLQWDKSLTLTDQRRRRTMASPGARSEIARDRDSRDPSQSLLSYLKLRVRVSKLMAQYYHWEMDLSAAQLRKLVLQLQRHQLLDIGSNWIELSRCGSKLSQAPPMMDVSGQYQGNNGHSLVTATARIHHNQLWSSDTNQNSEWENWISTLTEGLRLMCPLNQIDGRTLG